MSSISDLNARFAIPDRIQFDDGPGGQPMIVLFDELSVCEIGIHGAHVLCYRPKGREKIFWNSPESYEVPVGTAIRGGIPICWPWFGKHPTNPELPNHGFARLLPWTLIEASYNDKETWAVLELSASEATRRYIPQEFKLTCRIAISDHMRVELTTTNLSDEPFSLTEALHSYLYLSDIGGVSLTGLEGVSYRDTTPAARHATQDGAVEVTDETDRIYDDTSHAATLHDPNWKRTITIEKEGSRSTVVWNPWIERSKNIPDLTDDAYLQFLCVETANAAPNHVTIPPRGAHTIAASIIPSHPD